VGYAQVSTNHRQLLWQNAVLTAAGGGMVITDQVSRVREPRPGLVALLDDVRAWDRVVVALDRSARSLSAVMRPIKTLIKRGVSGSK